MTDNTFGDYEFPDFVPDSTRQSIAHFWGIWGRTYKDWLENSELQSKYEVHNGANGFGLPKLYDTADFILRDYKISKEIGEDRYKIVRGRFVHHWNNIGSIVDEFGESHHVSSCDRWIKVEIKR